MKTRVLVRDRITGLYLKQLGSWTQDEAKAAGFSCSATAFHFCLRHELTTAQIVLRFGDERYDLRFSVSEAEQRWPSAQNTFRKTRKQRRNKLSA